MNSQIRQALPAITRNNRHVVYVAALLSLSLLSACIGPGRPEGGIGPVVKWSQLEGWSNDQQAEAWPALMRSCSRLASRDDAWRDLCLEAKLMGEPNDVEARAFFETRFQPRRIVAGEDEDDDGLITGYYEPLLEGSRNPDARFRYAVYRRPADLLVVDLGELYEELKGKRVRGRLQGDNRVVPYFSRSEIEKGGSPLKGNEIAWVDDPVSLFFLHIQGSGIIRLRDGTMLAVGYHDQNGHPYYAIGRRLIQDEEIKQEDMSMQAIRDWLRNNPDRATDLLNENPSYVFFDVRTSTQDGPIGSLGVPLVAERSIAVDRRVIPLGLPVWLETSLPQDDPETDKDSPYRRLVFAQDTGGAINGSIRADLFWGRGERAADYAGRMRQPGSLYVLVPMQRSTARKKETAADRQRDS
jgi:membrane-bound lytic murein transglycosylase A